MKRIGLILAGMLALLAESAAQPTINSLITNVLVEPFGIAVDANNTVYLTDSANHLVYSYSSDNGLLTTLAGISGQSGNANGPGFVATFFSPKGIVLARGGLVVADSANHVLRFLSLTGSVSIVSDLAGISGTAGYLDGPAASAKFNAPAGLAVDASGNILIADSKNNAIRKLGTNNMVSTVAGGFSEPAGVAVDPSQTIYIADTRNNVIKFIGSDGNTRVLAGSTARNVGTNDSIFAEQALFNSPSALIWVGGNIGLLVSDSGNHTLRRIYFNSIIAQFFPSNNGYSVATYAGLPQQPGLQDGLLAQSKLNSPMSMATDSTGGLLLADLGNHTIRRIQTTPQLPQVTDPVVGIVTIVVDQTTGKSVMQLQAVTSGIFNNDVVIAVKSEANTTTLFTSGDTPGLFQPDTIPVPNSTNSLSPPPFTDGADPSLMPPTMAQPRPDLTIKVVGTASGRHPSNLILSRFQFLAAPPTIVGDNPGSFTVSTSTTNAQVWYTTDGSDPTNAAPSIRVPFTGQATSAQLQLTVIGTNTITFKARAFKGGYQSSSIATKKFEPSNFQANQISFGFEQGEGSSKFVAAPGQIFMVPVTLSLLPQTTIFSMQFGLLVANDVAGTPPVGAPPVGAGQIGFQSMLLRKLANGRLTNIPPSFFFITNNIPPFTNQFFTNTVLSFTNGFANLMGVGWLETSGATNLFDSAIQNLVSFSEPHATIFTGQKVVVGGFTFKVPTTAQANQTYTLKVFRPSATSDGITSDLFIQAPTNGSLSSGAINSIKKVSIGTRFYIVGDTEPFGWFNAGDFGDSSVGTPPNPPSILNNDVMDIFMAAAYQLNRPPKNTDFYDAMDSCCNPVGGNIFDGNDVSIDSMQFGDGTLDVADIYVTFRRSLDPTRTWYARYWANGVLTAIDSRQFQVTNSFRGGASPNLPAEQIQTGSSSVKLATLSGSSELPFVRFRADSVQTQPGATVEIPIRAEVHGKYPARVLLMNLRLEALDGAPPITVPVEFSPVADLGLPTLQHSVEAGNYAAAWLNVSADTPGVGANGDLVGILKVALPKDAMPASAYRVHFESISSSPNGLGVLPQEVEDGLISFADHSASSWGDRIPDSWRLKHFGSAARNNPDAALDADPDGDGMSNWAEFLAGTNPVDPKSNVHLQVEPTTASARAEDFRVCWRSVSGKEYALEYSLNAAKPQWTVLADHMAGSGGFLEMKPPATANRALFFRIRLK